MCWLAFQPCWCIMWCRMSLTTLPHRLYPFSRLWRPNFILHCSSCTVSKLPLVIWLSQHGLVCMANQAAHHASNIFQNFPFSSQILCSPVPSLHSLNSSRLTILMLMKPLIRYVLPRCLLLHHTEPFDPCRFFLLFTTLNNLKERLSSTWQKIVMTTQHHYTKRSILEMGMKLLTLQRISISAALWIILSIFHIIMLHYIAILAEL